MLTTIHISRSAPWLPPSLLQIPGEIRRTVCLSEPERKIFRRHKKILPSFWAERYRHVTMSVLPGKWKNNVTPYLAGIMDASFFPSVRTIIICKTPQVGGSEAVLNCIGYAIDRDPGPVLFIYPDQVTAAENCNDRIQPMIKQSPRLRSYMTGQDDDESMYRINLQHMPIYMAWARSAARMANKPIRYEVFEETDKYPEHAAGKREAAPIALGEARTITYRHNRKIWKISTPTTRLGNICQALNKEAQVIFDFWATCPACGHHHLMTFAQIKWPRKSEPGPDGKIHSEDPEIIEAEKLAWHECPSCLAKLNDYDRDLAVLNGKWRDRKSGMILWDYLKKHRPVKIGFHIPSRISPFVSLSEPAACFLRGLTDVEEFKNWKNKHEAEPWELTVTSKDKNQVLAACCDLPAQTVPENAIALTVGVDVQQHGFWFVVRAWAPDLTSWMIHCGFLATWEEVENLLFNTSYPVGDTGRSLRIFRALVDTGGGRKFVDMTMTEETYFWLLKNRGRGGVALWGAKGSSKTLPGMLSVGNAIVSTPSGKKLPEALRLLSIDTEKGKDQYHHRLQLASLAETRGMPGAAYLHKDTGDDYVGQILAEQKRLDEKGREEWVNVHSRPNHLFDAEVLAAACVEMEFPGGGLRLLAEAARLRENPPQRPEEPKTEQKQQKPRRFW